MIHSSTLRWHVGHQIFFIFIQSTLLALSDIEYCYQEGKKNQGKHALRRAAEMMKTSALAMRFAADFPQGDYEKIIRPSMPDKFSGLGSMDHAYMVRAMARFRKNKEKMHDFFGEEYENFVLSVDKAYSSHIHVCDKFVESKKSLRTGNSNIPATDVLADFKNKRISSIRTE